MSKHEHGGSSCCGEEHGKGAEGEEHHEAHAKSGDSGSMTKIIYGLMFVLALLMGFNQMLISGIAGGAPATGGQSGSVASAASSSPDLSSADTQALVAATIPTGTPEYGASAKASFDNPVQSISVLAGYENSVTLSDSEMGRYIAIVSQISCEYCCVAPSIIDSKGRAACGCAHSGAMRGLGKWLIKNRPAMSDDAILEELGKWKTLFFPKDSIKKAMLLKANNIEFNYVNLQSNKYRNIAATGGAQQAAGNLGALPSQVGGC